MAGDIIKLNKPMMLEMKAEFRRCEEELNAALSETGSLAQEIDDGALLGDGGNLLSTVLRENLRAKLTELREKAVEMQKDIQTAIDRFEEIDRSTGGRMSSVAN